ncbi:MAG: carboxyl transferase domain-containing protein, partial [bacterium]
MRNKEKRAILNHDSRIGIINRGEAALRFIRAAREYNILYHTNLATIAFYIDSEEEALFVKEADDQCRLSSVSGFGKNKGIPYCNKEFMIEALKYSGCQAVWVGWGFLAEDADFARIVEDSGLVFIGPSSQSMALLGDKISAKELAEKALVPILPWSKGPVKEIEKACSIAEHIGYPIIVKAANTGGGRGIRFVRVPEELVSQYQSAKEETIRTTGNDILFLEHLVVTGRHLEVQVLADHYGNVRTFGVRDCSVQRRNQKIIEETPPPHFDQHIIKAMEDAAARLIRKARYESAATVEFIFDVDKGEFYFMEVNTRLQVEHPITEQVHHIDLVKGQIHVQMGNKLEQTSTRGQGVAIEVRLNAEDPDRDFIPAPGKVSQFKIPSGPGIRVDSGIEQGNVIPTEFDSMIAKIIAYAPSRSEALARLERALREMRIKIEGGTSNRALLLGLLKCSQIKHGGVHTHFVEDMLQSQKEFIHRDNWDSALIACAIEQAICLYHEKLLNFKQQWSGSGQPKDISSSRGYEIPLNLKGQTYLFFVRALENNIFHVTVDGNFLVVQYIKRGHESTLLQGPIRHLIQIVTRDNILQCEVDGIPYFIERESSDFIRAPFPAIVLSIAFRPGQAVQKGDLLVELEAMKMLMIIEAPESGTIKALCIREGEQVAAGQPLIHLDKSEQKEIQKEASSSRICFKVPTPGDIYYNWHIMERELLAVFLGYDYEEEAPRILDGLLDFVKKNASFQQNIIKSYLDALEIYAAVETLFSNKQIESEEFARAGNYQELLMHFFIRNERKKKGLPQQFLDSLERAIKWYPHRGLNGEGKLDQALFRIYKSHSILKIKQDVLRSILFSMKELPHIKAFGNEVSDLLDEIAQLTLEQKPSLADSAIQARYHILDSIFLENTKKKRRTELNELADYMVKPARDRQKRDQIIINIINSGHYIVHDLVALSLDPEKEKQKLALELLGKYFNRDRNFLAGAIIEWDVLLLYRVFSGNKKEKFETLIVVADEKGLREKMEGIYDYFNNTKIDTEPELILLVSTEREKGGEKEESFLYYIYREVLPVRWCCVGLFDKNRDTSYHTYIVDQDWKWQEKVLCCTFNPLIYRELKIYLLANFHLKLLYSNESVHLVSGIAKNNPKDERLFALVNIMECQAEFNDDGSIQRIVAFDYAFMEALSAMSVEQSKRKRRLSLNRIIIHFHSLFSTNLKHIRDYASKLVTHTKELGLEKVIIYAHRRKRGEEVRREFEIHFKNISKDHFTMGTSIPSQALLEPMSDNYVSKVVRARQRGAVYPYEIIKMITHMELGYSKRRDVPQGIFEEFDIKVDKGTGEQEIFPLKARPYGRNAGNIVFGIITNYTKNHPYGLIRVIILVDASVDMGALTEKECRRVIAALDLAEKRKLVVEWLPISSGAKIDMKSGTENLDWTASVLKRIIEFTQAGGIINIIVSGINVGAQSYWNAEATMLMHTKGILIMTEDASMLLTGKKALDFSGSVSAENNISIGGVERIMGPNGQAQVGVKNLSEAYAVLFHHYHFTYVEPGKIFPRRLTTRDNLDRDITFSPYVDRLQQGFNCVRDIFSKERNPERKKPFEMRQVMSAIIDQDHGYLERWKSMKDAETTIVWETRMGGCAVGMIGIESRSLVRLGVIPHDGPESWSGGTLYPQSSKKAARAINAFSNNLPLVILANLSGFDGSPESLRKTQLEFGAEIGRAIVNFKGPIIFIVVSRYHGGAYVVFSRNLNPSLHAIALEGTYASVIGGAPAAAVIFPKIILKETYADPRITDEQKHLKDTSALFQEVYAEKQTALAQQFDQIHTVERAKKVGSINDIISPANLRPYLIKTLEKGM